MGEGWQALVRVAALDVLRGFPEDMRGRVVLLFEEPETYLHPHLRRRLRTVLEQLSEDGWLIIVATHSPEFVCFGSDQQISRLSRRGDENSCGSMSSAAVSNSARFQERLDEHGNHELLFATRAVIVEGKDDFFAIRCCLAKLGVDLDARGVSILGVGGVENLPEYAKIASKLRIPWCAVTDEDKREDGTIGEKTANTRATLELRRTAEDLMAMWPVSLERCVGLAKGKATPRWQSSNLEPCSLENAEREYPQLVSVCRRIREWIEASQPLPERPDGGHGSLD
jgi:predicted ATP-dependent endonuclease of OLD family